MVGMIENDELKMLVANDKKDSFYISTSQGFSVPWSHSINSQTWDQRQSVVRILEVHVDYSILTLEGVDRGSQTPSRIDQLLPSWKDEKVKIKPRVSVKLKPGISLIQARGFRGRN
jgi:hypothetical protein